MRIFFVGATGVIGRSAVPLLVGEGHRVSAQARRDEAARWLRSVGAEPVHLDLFDPAQVSAAVAGHDAVIHYATSIPPAAEMRRRRAWEMNDRLRSEATTNLVGTAVAQGVELFLQESITFFYADGGDDWLDEEAAVSPDWEALESALEAERSVAGFTAGGGRGVVLRFSRVYGPGRASAEYLAGVERRQIPIFGSGGNWVSHIHTVDAGSATRAALGLPAGVYNVSEDEPVKTTEELALLAESLGAPPPRRVPLWLGRLLAGPLAARLAISHRVSNRRFREATGWAPRYPSVRQGWPAVLGEPGGE